jgi:dTDP-4-dehydrorhamnose reductase
MLGQACLARLATMPGWTSAGTQRRDPGAPWYVDVSRSSDSLERVLESERWDYVINAVGVLRALIDPKDLDSVREAVRINAVLPHELAAAAGRSGTRVIHVSTDAVFGGSAEAVLTEASPTSPSDFYGNTKALGECDAANVINVRCSIVGRDRNHRRGLVEWLLASPPGSTVNGFVDVIWSAATTTQVADLCVSVIRSRVFESLRAQSPVFHFAPNEPVSKYEFLRTLAEVAERDVNVVPASNPDGAMKRVLDTHFPQFRELLPQARPWKAVLTDALAVPSQPSR